MLKIRLQRVGRKHEPSFRLVLTDSKNSTKSGRFTEILGSYDPRKTTEQFNPERIKHWLSMGAAPTASVNNLLIKKSIIRGKKIDVSAVSKKAPVETKMESPVVEAPTEVSQEEPKNDIVEKVPQEKTEEEKPAE